MSQPGQQNQNGEQQRTTREAQLLERARQREANRAEEERRRNSDLPADCLSRVGEGWFHLARCGQLAESYLSSPIGQMVNRSWVVFQGGREVCRRNLEGDNEPLHIDVEDFPQLEMDLLPRAKEFSSKIRTLTGYFPRETGDERLDACRESVRYEQPIGGQVRAAELEPRGEGELWEGFRGWVDKASRQYRQAMQREERERQEELQRQEEERQERLRLHEEDVRRLEAQRRAHLTPLRRRAPRGEGDPVGEPPSQRPRTDQEMEERTMEECSVQDAGLPTQSTMYPPQVSKQLADLVPDLLVGRRVYIHFGGERLWFTGTIAGLYLPPENPNVTLFQIRYEDGQQDSYLDLTREYFRMDNSFPRPQIQRVRRGMVQSWDVFMEQDPAGTQEPGQPLGHDPDVVVLDGAQQTEQRDRPQEREHLELEQNIPPLEQREPPPEQRDQANLPPESGNQRDAPPDLEMQQLPEPRSQPNQQADQNQVDPPGDVQGPQEHDGTPPQL